MHTSLVFHTTDEGGFDPDKINMNRAAITTAIEQVRSRLTRARDLQSRIVDDRDVVDIDDDDGEIDRRTVKLMRMAGRLERELERWVSAMPINIDSLCIHIRDR